MEISIETLVDAPLKEVWNAWVTPESIMAWNFAIEKWCCPSAEIHLKLGGTFCYRMEAKDGSMGFDFEGVFTKVEPYKLIQYSLGDDREVSVAFIATEEGVKVVETFTAEDENTAEQQRNGWLGILNNFKAYVERPL